jgi:hypothetical protein
MGEVGNRFLNLGFFAQSFDIAIMGNHPQEERAKFGQ